MLGYIYAKVLKKVRGKALLNSSVAGHQRSSPVVL